MPSVHTRLTVSRRRLLKGAAPIALASTSAGALAAPATASVEPFPIEAVRLKSSAFLTALDANRRYLLQLDPDRLLHNYRTQAGLEPKGAVYGGWEDDTIAGHTLGHYLSALSLMHAQVGDAECARRVGYIVGELALCQAQAPDGFVAGFTRRRGAEIENGKLLFEEIKRGQIHSTGFDLNGGWSPLYNWHKLMAGLLDADRYCGERRAIAVAERLGGYIEGVFAPLDDAQTQKVLACEYGGLNESFAELYARTGHRRWLVLSQRLYDRKVLDPLAQGQDDLANLHANTQIPKLIGLARLYEITGDPRDAKASETFWTLVTSRYSYVIGGHGDREYFQAPNSISKHITEQTCESCNSYNMLKLTRRLYAQDPKASYFDYYERTHLNHILAQQNPRTGMFAYMTPLMSGEARAYSKPYDDFWCCVGTGMESHSKHGDSIYWRRGHDALFVNLYIPSQLNWADQGARFDLSTDYPASGRIRFSVLERRRKGPLAIALRVPAWASGVEVSVNGAPLAAQPGADGYIRIRRSWRGGDVVELNLPLRPRVEPTADDPSTLAILHGPLVLAADLGPADQPYGGVAPALVGASVLAGLASVDGQPGVYRTEGMARPADLTLSPFAALHERRTAVYFKSFTLAGWQAEQAAYLADQAKAQALAARSADVMHLGEMQAERDHDLTSDISYPVVYRGRNGRDARSGGYFQFRLKTRPGPLVLQATYWGEERNRSFKILVDGVAIAADQLTGDHPGAFFERDYPIPLGLTQGKSSIVVRFSPDPDHTAGPVFGVRLFTAEAATSA
jgi:DUF1680 family protein